MLSRLLLLASSSFILGSGSALAGDVKSPPLPEAPLKGTAPKAEPKPAISPVEEQLKKDLMEAAPKPAMGKTDMERATLDAPVEAEPMDAPEPTPAPMVKAPEHKDHDHKRDAPKEAVTDKDMDHKDHGDAGDHKDHKDHKDTADHPKDHGMTADEDVKDAPVDHDHKPDHHKTDDHKSHDHKPDHHKDHADKPDQGDKEAKDTDGAAPDADGYRWRDDWSGGDDADREVPKETMPEGDKTMAPEAPTSKLKTKSPSSKEADTDPASMERDHKQL